MIPLSSIDYSAVLKGARIPLHHPHNAPDFRVEWNVDRIINIGDTHFESLVLGVRQSAEYLTFAAHETLALDPTDPDVARVLDMRIAESYIPSGPEMGAILWVRDGRFVLLMMGVERFMFRWHNNGKCYSYTNHRTPHMDCPSIPHIATPANIPAARAALIRALYPRTA